MKSLFQNCHRHIAFTILILTVTAAALAQVAPPVPEPIVAPAPASPPDVQRDEMDAVMVGSTIAREKASALGDKMRQLGVDLYGMSQRGSSRVLVIPAAEMQGQDLAQIVEDMTVMARIIDRQLGQQQPGQVWFSGDVFGQTTRTAQTMYLQGYGALFLRKVDFPLTPPPAVQQEEKETKEENADPVWEQMKREMYEPQDTRRRKTDTAAEKYDQEKVETLKTNLIKALKHTSNIRILKPDESVTLAVTGGGESANVDFTADTGTNQLMVKYKDKRTTGIVTPNVLSGYGMGGMGDSGFSPPVVLIVRAKKADIDAFAKGDIDLGQFRQRVQIFTQ